MATPETFIVGAQMDATSVTAGIVRLSDHAELDAVPLSTESASTPRDRLSWVIQQVRLGSSFFDVKPIGIGIALPAEIDEENLTRYLDMTTHLPAYLLDANHAYGLGVHAALYPNERRLMTVTVGENLGSEFIVDGESAGSDNAGSTPFYGKHLEDLVSSNGVVTYYNRLADHKNQSRDAREIADAARIKGRSSKDHNTHARNAYSTLGYHLAHGLADTIQTLKPARIVLGGPVAADYDLFGPVFESRLRKIEGLEDHDIQITTAVDQNYTLIGAASYARGQMLKAS